MKHQRVEMAIVGPGAKPELVPVHVLTEILGSLERAVTAFAVSRSGCAPEDCPRLSLVAVQSGSELLSFAVPEPVLPYLAEISGSLARRDFESVPRAAYSELVNLSQAVERREWSFEIQARPELGIASASFGRGAPLPPPAPPPRITGTTAIHGKCLRVGGATSPKAEVRLTSNDQILYVDLSEELARELAPRLYEEVMLEGEATWEAETWKIESFRVSAIRAHEPGEPEVAFRELAEAAGDQWTGVDAAGFVRALRAE